MPAIAIRAAGLADASRIAELTGQLGYELSATTAADRLSRILRRRDEELVIAEVEGQVAGMLHVTLAEYIDAPRFVLVAGVVVDRTHRGRGVGRALMEYAESWARQHGCSVVRLASSSTRTGAHRFYESIGYTNIKTQYSFIKLLDEAAGVEASAFVPRVEPQT